MTTRRALGSPAVQRGLASIVAAILILAFPELVTKSLFILVSIGALVFGAIELVDWWRGGKKEHLLLVKALLLVAGGVSIIVFRERAVRVTELVLAGILALRAISNLYAARRRWKAEGEDPFWDVIKAAVALLLAATLVLIPETLLSLVVILLGLGWVLAGLVVLVNALGDGEESKAAPSDLVGVLREKTMPGDLRRQIISQDAP